MGTNPLPARVTRSTLQNDRRVSLINQHLSDPLTRSEIRRNLFNAQVIEDEEPITRPRRKSTTMTDSHTTALKYDLKDYFLEDFDATPIVSDVKPSDFTRVKNAVI